MTNVVCGFVREVSFPFLACLEFGGAAVLLALVCVHRVVQPFV